MAVRNYSNITNVGTLSAAVGTGETTLPINGGWSNLPAFPFYVIVDRGNSLEECMLATSGNATALDVTRGYDGSPTSSHGSGATIEVAVLAEFFNKADQHTEASTNVHGLSGGAGVVGTTSTQTLTNKTINSSVLSLAHSTSPAGAQAVQVAADAATARDGFVWTKTVAATGAAFKAVSGGTTRYTVDADGKVVLNSTTGTDKALSITQSGTERAFIQNDGTVDFGLQASGATADRVTIRNRPTQNALRIKDEGGFNILTIGTGGNVDASGYIASAGAVSSGTTMSVGSNLTVTGTSTLTGDVTLPLPAAGTTPRINVRGRSGGLLLEGKDQAGTVVYTVGVDGGGTANGKWFIHDKSSPAVAKVTSTAVVPLPNTDMLVFDVSDRTLKEYNGSTWVVVGKYGVLGTYTNSVQNTSGTTSSGAFTTTLTGGTTCSLTFVAPASGKVDVHNTCQTGNSGAAISICSHEVREGATIGAGTVIQAAAIENGVYSSGTSRATVVTPVTGLTPGSTYNVQQWFVNTGGTGTFVNKQLIVRPAE